MNKKSRNTSIKGGILTCAFIIVAILYIINEIKNWVGNVYYTKYSQVNYLAQPLMSFRDYPNFMMVFCVGTEVNSTFRDSNLINSLNISLSWHYTIREPWLYENEINIKLKSCKKTMFPKAAVTSLTFKIYEHCSCADSKSLAAYNISYAFTDTFNSYLAYNIKFNDDILNDPTKYQQAYTYLKQNPSRSFAYFVDSIGNIDDYTSDVFTYFMNYKFNFINPDVLYIADMYLNAINVVIDDNYVNKSKFMI
jgi:hypothetical protein